MVGGRAMSPKDHIASVLDAEAPRLIDLSHRIHAHPELMFEEELASQWLCESLDELGFAVTAGAGTPPPALQAPTRRRPPHIPLSAPRNAPPRLRPAGRDNTTPP